MSRQSGRGGGNGNNNQRRDEAESRALVTVDPPRMPLPPQATAQGITIERWRALIDAVYPSAKTLNGVLLALDYCKARNLDPFKRVVHVVPMWNSKLGREVETVWPGIGELRTTASRTGQHAGNDDCVFGRMMRQSFRDSRTGQGGNGPYETAASCPEMDFPEWAQITVYKIVAGQRVPFVGPKVYFIETFSGEKGLRVPNARWRLAPRQMLEKCAEAAALRRAFPEELGEQFAAEEMEGKTVPGGAPTAEAQYHYVTPDEADGGGQDTAAQVADPQPEEERDLNGWQPDRLADFMSYLENGLASVPTIDILNNAIGNQRGRIDTLPAAEKRKVAELEAAARERLQPNEPAETDHRQSSDQRQEHAEQHREQSDQQVVENEEPAFVRNFRRRVDAVELVADLDSLERSEKRAIDQQPGGVARACDRIIADKRAALQA